MNAATTKKIIRLRFRRLKRYATHIKEKAGTEDIHAFRVEVKKLRAFVRLLQEGQDKIKIPRPLKKAYRKAGLVRSLQLHRQIIKDARDKPEGLPVQYLKQVDKKISAAKKDLKQALQPALLRRAKAKMEKKLQGALRQAAVREFYQKKLTAVRDMFSAASMDDEQWHTTRKILKDILYNAKTFEADLSRRFPVQGWNKDKQDAYTTLTDELGKFQDSSTELLHLQSSPYGIKPMERKAVLALRRRQRQLKRRLLQSLKEKYKAGSQFL